MSSQKCMSFMQGNRQIDKKDHYQIILNAYLYKVNNKIIPEIMNTLFSCMSIYDNWVWYIFYVNVYPLFVSVLT